MNKLLPALVVMMLFSTSALAKTGDYSLVRIEVKNSNAEYMNQHYSAWMCNPDLEGWPWARYRECGVNEK